MTCKGTWCFVPYECQNLQRRLVRRTYETSIRGRPVPSHGAYAANRPGFREDRGRLCRALTAVRRVSWASVAPTEQRGTGACDNDRCQLSKPIWTFSLKTRQAARGLLE